MRHRNIQVKFEFCSALMIFERVMPLELRIKKRNSQSLL